jgi:hypothetical protein
MVHSAGWSMSRLWVPRILALVITAAVGYALVVAYPAFEIDTTAPTVERDGAVSSERVSSKPIDRSPQAPVIRLGVIPKLKLAHSTTASAEEADEIKRLIGRLATVEVHRPGPLTTDRWNVLSNFTMKPPFDLSVDATDGLEFLELVRRLTALGPKALPFLLDALEDATLTKAVLPEWGIQFSSTVWGNPVNARESKILGPWVPASADQRAGKSIYTLKIGDVCCAVIGNIVARPYATSGLVGPGFFNVEVKSPPRDAKLRQQVRELWSSKDSGQRLFDSLLVDYATQVIVDDSSCDGFRWRNEASLQAHAAARLLFYFSAETAELIAGRLDMLDVEGDIGSARARYIANGVKAKAFIEAVAWCDEPRVKAALDRVFDRTTDPDIGRAALRRRPTGPPR